MANKKETIKRGLWVKKSRQELEQLTHCIWSLDRECNKVLKEILELNGDETIKEDLYCSNCEYACGEVDVNERDRLVENLKGYAESQSLAIESLRVYFSHMPKEQP